VTAADRGRAVRGRVRAAARRSPKGAKAELPVRRRRVSRGRSRPPRRAGRTLPYPPGRVTSRGSARRTARGPLRAPLS